MAHVKIVPHFNTRVLPDAMTLTPWVVARRERAVTGTYTRCRHTRIACYLADVPNVPRTPGRHVRVPELLWRQALAKAEERGEVLAVEIRLFLVRYVKRR